MLILAAGAMGNPPILMRSRNDLPTLSGRLGRHLGINGDHVAAVEYDPKKIRDVLGLPGYGQFYKGRPITTMTYDFWHGRRAHQHDGTRFTLQEIFLSRLTNFLYDDGRDPEASRRGGACRRSARSPTWNNRIELLAMVEDTHDGRFYEVPPTGGGAVRPNAGPVAIGLFEYTLSEASIRVRERANAAMKRIAERDGLGRFMKLTETRGGYASHPLGGCRMAESAELGVVDHALRGVRQRGALLHGLVGDSHVARSEPVADDRGRVRAGGRAARPRALTSSDCRSGRRASGTAPRAASWASATCPRRAAG